MIVSISRRFPLPALAICLFLFAADGLRAQAPALYRVAGTVVSKTSGEPVPRASVALLSAEDSSTVASVYSDQNGRFALDNLPEGRYQLVVAKRGYLTSLYEEHEFYNSAIVTGPGLKTDAIVFRLTPAASLSVTVIDEAGDPIENAQIRLFPKVQTNGRGKKTIFLTRRDLQTDDIGKIMIGDLEPGDYFVAVSARPWFAMKSNRSTGTNSSLDLAYPLTLYNGVTDQNAATPITLQPGRNEAVQITLQAVPALHLSIPAIHGSKIPNFAMMLFGYYFYAPGLESQDNQDNFEFSGIAPGHYRMELDNPPRELEFDPTSNQQLAANTGNAATTLRVKLMMDKNEAHLEYPTPQLVWADRSHPQPPQASTQEDGCFVFHTIVPGLWELQVFNRTIYPLPILSITNNGVEHPGNLLKVTDRTRELTVHLSTSSGHISGFAKVGGQGKAGAMVVLVPPDPAAHGDYFRRDQADSDGSFNLLNVAPGSYTIVAIDEGWDLEWQRPEVIARFLSHGVPVHLSDGEQKPLQLAAPIPVQKADGTLLAPATAETSPQSPPGTSSKPGGEGSL